MKNWKKFILLAFIGFFCIVVAFNSCDNGNETKIDGSEVQKTYTGTEVPGMKNSMIIIKDVGVTDVQMTGILNELKRIYNDSGWSAFQNDFEIVVLEIRVKSGNAVPVRNGTTFEITCNDSISNIEPIMVNIALGFAKHFDSSKNTVRLAMVNTKLQKMI